MEVRQMLQQALDCGASDIFIIAGLPLTYKVNGRQRRCGERLMPADTEAALRAIYALAGRDAARLCQSDADDDFSFAIPQMGRFRANVLHQRGTLAAVLRVIRFGLPDPAASASRRRCWTLRAHARALCLSPARRATENRRRWPA